MKLFLTPSEKQTLVSQHNTTRDGRVRDRIKSVIHASNDWSVGEIADALLIHENTVRQHLKEYSEEKKLKPRNGGSESFLTEEQTREVVEHLTHNTYAHTHQICIYIQQTFGITYSVPGLNKWLHKNGFSYKQPKGVPHKFDSEKQDNFIEEYETLKAELAEDETIIFMDAVHPTQATKVCCGWIRKGTDKAIETTGSRTRLNLVGGIELGKLSEAVIRQYDTVNGDTIMDFFEQLRDHYNNGSTLHVILDGAGYHRSEAVKESAKKLNIKLHYLPPYSPNLNPIERLWKVMNEQVRNNRYFATAKAFREQIQHFIRTILPDIGSTLDSRINDNFQRFYPTS